MFYFASVTTPKKQSTSGFSLIELLVTISIMILVTGIVLARYSAFDGAVLLKNQAYDIALDIRKVQSYGLGSTVSNAYRFPYGVYFSTSAIDSIDQSRYLIFQDNDGPDGIFISSADSEYERRLLRQGFVVTNLTANGANVTQLYITFERPNFDPIVNGAGTNATITITDTDTSISRTIVIGAGGYISVQ